MKSAAMGNSNFQTQIAGIIGQATQLGFSISKRALFVLGEIILLNARIRLTLGISSDMEPRRAIKSMSRIIVSFV